MINLSHIQNHLSGRTAGILGQERAMHAAVILPLVYVENELSILFEVRAHHLKRQPSEICFPGGRIDLSDPSPKLAAIRELTEELGVKNDHISIIAPLDVLVTPFRGIIYPFVGELNSIEDIQVNTDEVDHFFTVPLSFLYEHKPERHDMNIRIEPESNFPLNKISNGTSYSNRADVVPELFYYYKDYIIWGLTARILAHFIELTKPKSSN